MAKQKVAKSKVPAPAPYKVGGAAKAVDEKKKTKNPLFTEEKIGGSGQPLKKGIDLGRYVRWPRYVRIQRQRKVLYSRLKVPPAIHQFSYTLDKNNATALFRVLHKYKPEDRAARQARRKAAAEAKASGAAAAKTAKPVVLKYGLNHITKLVETSKAKLVVIAHDVDPIELVVWLPALCHKRNVPFVIVKGKSRLGQLVHKKTATAVALTGVRAEDQKEFAQLLEVAKANYEDTFDEHRRVWGGGSVGIKSQHVMTARKLALERELKQKMQA